VAGAALLPVTGKHKHTADIPEAVAAEPADTARELRDIKRDQAMTLRALNILEAGGADAYQRGLSSLREDTRASWKDCLEQPPDDGPKCAATAEALAAWLRRHRKEWYEDPIAELEHRDAIRDQALGAAYSAPRWGVVTRYEVHLDRKLERTLAMLVRLKELRRPTVLE
jgi:hypothetical protein